MDKNVLIILCVYLTQADQIVAIFYFLKKNIVGASVKKKNDYSI